MPFVKVLCSQDLHLSVDLFTEIFRIKYFAAGGGALNPEVVLMGMCTGPAGSSLAGGLSFFWPTTEGGGCGQVSLPRSVAGGEDKHCWASPGDPTVLSNRDPVSSRILFGRFVTVFSKVVSKQRHLEGFCLQFTLSLIILLDSPLIFFVWSSN